MTPVERAKEVFDHYASMDAPDVPWPDWQALQVRLARWERCNFGIQPLYRNVLGACEELGELSHALLKHEQQIRGQSASEAFRETAGDAIADTVVYLMNLCTKLRLDFDALVHAVANDVMQRDWQADPEHGGDVEGD